jgi:GTP cyclohydrolase II
MDSNITCLARCDMPVRDKRMDLYLFGSSREREPTVAALVNGFRTYPDDATLLRIHSACFTGDVLGSERCDCGRQLAGALDLISRAPWGIVLYFLRHEGRGIGLLTKLRAYALQEEGFDTATANQELHAPIDAREYSAGIAALDYLGVNRVWLLTNNPEKLGALPDRIVVEGVQSIACARTMFNSQYLAAKESIFGHQFGDMHFSDEPD